LGHVLCSGSGDFTTKFWSRNKPGDKMKDKYNITQIPGNGSQTMKLEDVVEPYSFKSLPGIQKRPRSPSSGGNYDQKRRKEELPGIRKFK
jgi:hypothetical protein